MAPSEEPAPVVEDTAGARLQGDPRPNGDAESDPSTSQSSEQSADLLSPVIIVTQQSDESLIEGACGSEETQEKVQPGTDAPSATAESSVTADSDAGQEAGTPDAPANPASMNPIPNPPDLSTSPLSSPLPSDVPPECAQNDQSAAPQDSATPDLSTSEQATENQASVQHPCPTSSHPPYTGGPMKISLGLLSEAIGCNSAAPSVMQTMAQNPTDRAVYLTGEMKDNWEMERVQEERWKEAHERIKEGKEETGGEDGEEKERERGGGKMGSVVLTSGEPVNEGCGSSDSQAGGATTLNTGQRASSEEDGDDGGNGRELETEKRKEDDEEADERGGHAGKDGKKEKEEQELLQSPPPMESQRDCGAELQVDSVSVIRQLVTEITEVETVISPCPNP